MTACDKPDDYDCACGPTCYRICTACAGEMCMACGFSGVAVAVPSPEGNNIFVHQHPDVVGPALSEILMMCRDRAMADL